MENGAGPLLVGSDHAGFAMKEFVKSELARLGIACEDVGAFGEEPCDYPLYAARVARRISRGQAKRGVLVCGTGIGASITANRFRGVRAALCTSEEMAGLSRRHNDANVLVLGGRTTSTTEASKILAAWLNTSFEGGRHARRIQMIDEESER